MAGRGWAPVGHPQRFRATYHRYEGTEQLLAFYDVHADCLVGQLREHKRVDDLLAVFARLRACYPLELRLYVVMDNLNTHKHARLRAFMAAHNIEPVYTPTYASWLNAIESHFTPLKKFAIAGTDDSSPRVPPLAHRPLPDLAQPLKGDLQGHPRQVPASQVVPALA